MTSTSVRSNRRAVVLGVICVGMLAAGMTAASAYDGFVMPRVPPYPYYGEYETHEGVVAEAEHQSTELAAYVEDWLDGEVPAELPPHLVPEAANPLITGYRLIAEDEIDPRDQWIYRPGVGDDGIDRNDSPGLFPEPQATYLLMPNYQAPFGHTAVLTGDFPHARYFSVQATPSFEPEHYGGLFGIGEIPIVDADIEPDPGNVNPFRVGADRTATNRAYTVHLESMVGAADELTPAYRPETGFRAGAHEGRPVNWRPTSGTRFVGPWGHEDYQEYSPLRALSPKGRWAFGEIWIRYFLPDRGVGPLAGVDIPKVVYETPDGDRYFIQAELGELEAAMNATEPIEPADPEHPGYRIASNIGWYNLWGILRNGFQEVTLNLQTYEFDKSYVRGIEKGVSGKAEDLDGPASYKSTESLTPYQTYFQRGMSIGEDHVAVLTGRKPVTPTTVDGDPVMQGGEARWYSITTYDDFLDLFDLGRAYGQPISTVYDEQIITDEDGYFTIVFAREDERPANATAENGVTFVEWGPRGTAGVMWRWTSIQDEWSFDLDPNEINLGRETDRSSVDYDRSVIGENDRDGFLGDYQPVWHYLPRTEFEALGDQVAWDQIPVWDDPNYYGEFFDGLAGGWNDLRNESEAVGGGIGCLLGSCG